MELSVYPFLIFCTCNFNVKCFYSLKDYYIIIKVILKYIVSYNINTRNRYISVNIEMFHNHYSREMVKV